MSRKPRELKKYTSYHIMVQGINKEPIFHSAKNKRKYLESLIERIQEYHSIILAYCIMNNHAHFLVYNENDFDISEIFQRVNNAYSNFYNKCNNRVGYVFRDRFLSQQIFDDGQLSRCIDYIHNNPVKANYVDKPNEYIYSSANEYIEEKSAIVDVKLVKEIFNVDYINNDTEYEFIDVKEFDKENFEQYLYGLNIDMLKSNKYELKKIVKECRFDLNAPVYEISKGLDIPVQTVYRWLRQGK